MDSLGWVFLILAIALLLGGISTAWRAFSRPPRIRSAEMKKLDAAYFEGDISREEYVQRKTALEARERREKAGRPE